MRKQVEVNCDFCNKSYLKDESEVKRNQKLGRKSFCSYECMGKNNTKYLENVRPGASHLNPSNRRDEFTGFREHLLRAKRRDKYCDLDLQYLKELWESQSGICVYSNVELIPPLVRQKNNPIYTASLDRKDSSKGYIKGNVQFISIAMNHMKGEMSEEEIQILLNILKI